MRSHFLIFSSQSCTDLVMRGCGETVECSTPSGTKTLTPLGSRRGLGCLAGEGVANRFIMVMCIQYFDAVILAVVYPVPFPLGLFCCFRVKVSQVGLSAVHRILCLGAAGSTDA